MKHLMIAASAAALLATPLSAQSYRAEGRVNVNASGNTILVQNGAGFGARGMWCGAASYARNVLGAPGTARLYVTQPRSAANRRAPVGFALSPQGTPPVSALVLGRSINTAGANLSVDHAGSFCNDFKLTNSR